MILLQIRPKGAAHTITVHPKITVVAGLDDDARHRLADNLAAALRGAGDAGVEVDVDIDGTRRPLTPQLARELGLAELTSTLAVFALDVPGAKAAEQAQPEPQPQVEPAPDPAPAMAAVDEERAKLGRAEQALREASERLASAQRSAASPDAAGAELAARIATLEGQLEAAQAGAAAAKRNLADAEEAQRREAAARAAAEAEVTAARDAALAKRTDLEASRAELVVRMVEVGDPGEPGPVEQALHGLRRLQQVKPKPSAQAAEVANRWAAILAKLASLPQPPQPPEWLVTPALAALHEAREALAEAESGPSKVAIDQVKIDALERAHREALEAEQKAMNKGSRANRRRLDQAHEQESAALAALGVSTYGEYLQRVAPMADGGSPNEDRIKLARAALADAEAVWEELHGGQASPQWTAAKEEQAEIRTIAFTVLGREVDDDVLDAALRGHLEIVVDTGWAEQELVLVLGRAGASIGDDDDVEEAAVRWLAESPAQREARAALEAELATIDQQLEAIEAELVPTASGTEGEGDGPTDAASTAGDPIAALAAAAREAEAAEKAAAAELAAAKQRQGESAEALAKQVGAQVAAAQGEADARRRAVDEQQAELKQAEDALAAIRQRIADAPAPAPAPTPEPAKAAVDLSGVVPMEAELYVLARVAGLRAAPGGPLPLLFDANAVAGLAPPAATRMLGLLERAAATVQVVVLGDDGQVGEWAKRLGSNGAAVHAAARQ